MRQNQRIIEFDACDPPLDCSLYRQSVQVAAPFLRNHAEAIAAIDLCLVPTVRFESLFAFVIIGHERRQLL